jgi:hypothetical protein
MAGTPLHELYEAEKTLSVIPGWQEVESGRLTLVAPLDIDGVTIEGMQLRGRARKNLVDENVSFQLECHSVGVRGGQIARIDWRPMHPHVNPARGAHKDLLRTRVRGSQIHSFERHYMRDLNRIRQRNLPWAEPLGLEPSNFSELLAVVGARFRIAGLEKVAAPPWEAELPL